MRSPTGRRKAPPPKRKAMPRRRQRQPPRLRKPINMRPDNSRSARYGFYAALLALPLAACGVFKGDGPPKTPTIGERVSILSNDNSIKVDPATAAIAVVLPEHTVNAAWAQSGGNASKSMGHPALGATRATLWEARIAGSTT